MARRHWLADPLPFGELEDSGYEYDEFICSKQTLAWLESGAMTHVNGLPIYLFVVEEVGPNVIVQVREQ